MEYKDYYKILGVEKNATAEDIKKQYRRLARKYHPDVSEEKNAEEKFKEVKEAYEVLKDPTKRKAYDQMGSQWQAGQHFTPPPGWEYQQQRSGSAEEFDASEFSDFFANLFGQRAHGAHAHHFDKQGQDQHSSINISLPEAFVGSQRMIQLQESELDPATGHRQLKNRNLNIKIPAGVTEGQLIRLAGLGSKGIGKGANGDLYLEIHFLDHPFYTAKNRDIYLHLPITPWEAALGAKIEVPTLGGKVGLTIPAGSQTGNKLRLKGRGLPGTPAGDQYVLLAIYIPEPSTETQRELYHKMAEEMHYDPRKSMLNKE